MTDTTLVWRHVEDDRLKAWLVDQPPVSQQEVQDLRVRMLQAVERAWCDRTVEILCVEGLPS
jgi:hypothetical protein